MNDEPGESKLINCMLFICDSLGMLLMRHQLYLYNSSMTHTKIGILKENNTSYISIHLLLGQFFDNFVL